MIDAELPLSRSAILAGLAGLAAQDASPGSGPVEDRMISNEQHTDLQPAGRLMEIDQLESEYGQLRKSSGSSIARSMPSNGMTG